MSPFNTIEHGDYLATEVFTASPQRLRLMLIEAALRQCQRAEQGWRNQAPEDAIEALIRAQQIVAELLGGVTPEADAELARRISGLYMFVFRNLVLAALEQSPVKLADARRILEMERETWQTLCAKLAADEQPAPHWSSTTAKAARAPAPLALDAHPALGGFSLEA